MAFPIWLIPKELQRGRLLGVPTRRTQAVPEGPTQGPYALQITTSVNVFSPLIISGHAKVVRAKVVRLSLSIVRRCPVYDAELHTCILRTHALSSTPTANAGLNNHLL